MTKRNDTDMTINDSFLGIDHKICSKYYHGDRKKIGKVGMYVPRGGEIGIGTTLYTEQYICNNFGEQG
jgi:hypothetical protein